MPYAIERMIVKYVLATEDKWVYRVKELEELLSNYDDTYVFPTVEKWRDARGRWASLQSVINWDNGNKWHLTRTMKSVKIARINYP